MTKTETIHNMLEAYHRHEAAHTIAVCFELEGVPMARFVPSWQLEPFMELTTASSHHDKAVSLRLSKLNKSLLAFLSEVCFPIGTAEDLQKALTETASGGRLNRGLAYEKLFFEHYSQPWKRDSRPWWEVPDFEFPEGLKVQIKSPRATFTTDAQLRRLGQ